MCTGVQLLVALIIYNNRKSFAIRKLSNMIMRSWDDSIASGPRYTAYYGYAITITQPSLGSNIRTPDNVLMFCNKVILKKDIKKIIYTLPSTKHIYLLLSCLLWRALISLITWNFIGSIRLRVEDPERKNESISTWNRTKRAGWTSVNPKFFNLNSFRHPMQQVDEQAMTVP